MINVLSFILSVGQTCHHMIDKTNRMVCNVQHSHNNQQPNMIDKEESSARSLFDKTYITYIASP